MPPDPKDPELRRILARIRDMQSKGVGDEGIDRYLRAEGYSYDGWTKAREQDRHAPDFNPEANTDPRLLQPNPVANALVQFGQGASFGLSDEISNMLPGQDYAREYMAAGREAYPGTSLAADLAGGIASGVMLPAAKIGGAAGTALKPLQSALRPTAGYGRATLQGIGLGAFEGFNRGEGMGERLAGAGIGAGAGAVLAPAIGGMLRAGQATGNVVGAIRSGLRPTAASETSQAAQALLGAIERPYGGSLDPIGAMRNRADAVLSDAGRLADVVPPAVYLGDVGRGMSVGVAQAGQRELAEQSATTAIRDITGTPDKPGRLLRGLAKSLGADEMPSSGLGYALDLRDKVKAVAEDAYSGLFSRNTTPLQKPEVTRSLADMMRRNAQRFNDAVRYANRTFEEEGLNLPRIVGGDTIDEWISGMTLRDAHRVRQALSALEGEAVRRGDRTALRGLTRARNEFSQHIDELFPEYGPARAQIADQYTLNEAFDLGSSYVSRGAGNIDELEAVKTVLSGENPDARKMFVIGALSDVIENVSGRANIRGTSNPASWLQRSQERFSRLASAFKDDAEITRFLGELAAAFEIGAQPQRLMGGSQTAFNQSANQQVIDAVSKFVQGAYNPSYGLVNVAASRIGKLGDPIYEASRRGIARMMFEPEYAGPAGANKLFGLLENAKTEREASRLAARAIYDRGAKFGGLLSGRISGGLLGGR